MKASNEEIYSKSMIYDFLLGTICKIFSRVEVEICRFRPLHSDDNIRYKRRV